MNSGDIKDWSPAMPPWTKACAIPKQAKSAHKPMYGPIPPLPDVARSNCHTKYSEAIILYANQNKWHTKEEENGKGVGGLSNHMFYPL